MWFLKIACSGIKSVNKNICNCYKGKFEDVDDENNSKVRNHCHYTGRYRGLSHTICVLK